MIRSAICVGAEKSCQQLMESATLSGRSSFFRLRDDYFRSLLGWAPKLPGEG